MARLGPRERAALPDRAFAYIDSIGHRRLPLHDPAHVRNALARFGQVAFENEAARERARDRLLRAAKKHRIVPVGFITDQLRSERARAGRRDPEPLLPSGFVTMLMTDIEGSTGLLHRVGERYGALLDEVRSIQRRAVAEVGGHEVEARADEFFAVFAGPSSALTAAAEVQRGFLDRSPDDVGPVRVRIGIHSGYPTSAEGNYIGLDVHTTARVCDVGHGGQIVVSGNTREASQSTGVGADVRFRSLGSHRLRGLPEAVPLFQVLATGLPTRFPALRGVPGG